MNEKLERLSTAVSEKYQEADQLNKYADELEQQIDLIRTKEVSPRKLALKKLELATVQG